MKVKELVQDTVWLPGLNYDLAVKPKISVLLPTFRRGKSGLFRRCVESILTQTLEDIELIIIDDGSTDGTANQIAEFLQKDGRVSCLRHPKNIGLPAISEYEGYLRARADRISFAFDDTMFNHDALEKLLKESEKAPWAVVYGHVEWSRKDPNSGEIITMRLGSSKSQGTLRAGNFIPNNGVLMPRSIIEDVGLYDPHIVIARLCDWDLWCRVAERYELKFVDVSVGLEDGPMTTDSLGNTYVLDSWAVAEWMRMARNEKLRPDNFANYEVLAADPSHGISTQTVCESLARKHAASRGWAIPLAPTTSDTAGYILVVNLNYDASTYLYFDMLPQEMAKRVRVITYNSGFGAEEMARATCVIFVRHINFFRPWIDAAKASGIPTYFFLDDNLPLLVEHLEFSIIGEDYRPTRFRNDMSLFDGVLLSSQNLLSYFEDNLIHENLLHFPVAFSDQRPLSIDHAERKEKGEIVIVSAGGSHRSKGFWEIVFPSLKKLAAEGAMIHLVTPKPDDQEYTDELKNLPPNMRVTTLPFEHGYLFAMRRFARYSPDFIVLAPSYSKNNPFKTLHPLVTARLIDAVLVVPDTTPYDQIAGAGNAIIVADAGRPISWYRTLEEVLNGKFDLKQIKERNNEFCAEHFSGQTNVDVLRNMLARHGGEPSWAVQALRLHKLAQWYRTTSGLSTIEKSMDSVDSGACELAAYRKMLRYSWRHRILQRNGDLWSSVSPSFERIKRYSADQGWRRNKSSLELSDSLHDIPYREYRITPPAGKLTAVMFAVSVDLVRRGLIGVEIVTPDNQIKDHVVIDLQRINLNVPVKFELSDVVTKSGETWAIRVFAESTTPVYIYEFINRRFFGLRFKNPTPFMELIIE